MVTKTSLLQISLVFLAGSACAPESMVTSFRLKQNAPNLPINIAKTAGDENSHEDHESLWLDYLQRPHPKLTDLIPHFRDMATYYNVPGDLLMAIAQVETNWTQIGPSIDKGWGIMHLTENNYSDTLGLAANLLKVDRQTLKDDPFENIRGAAAVLAYLAGDVGMNFINLEDWVPAAREFSGLKTSELKDLQVEEYYRVLKEGVRAETIFGETLILSPHPEINLKNLSQYKSKQVKSPDYPDAIANITSCNYSSSRNLNIDTWTIHYIGTGTYAGAISWFHNCDANASAHFVIRASDGQITQVVPTEKVAWHAGASGYPNNNRRSIGVEHEATITHPEYWNSEPLLQSSTRLAKHFSGIHNIPRARSRSNNPYEPGIRGHQEMPGASTACPGPIPWNRWMELFMAKLSQ